MAEVRIQDARPGMILDTDVVDEAGHVLLKAGISLSGRHLALLHAHGVAAIQAGDTPDAPDAPADVDSEQLFRNLDPDHPLTQKLRRLHRQRHSGGDDADES